MEGFLKNIEAGAVDDALPNGSSCRDLRPVRGIAGQAGCERDRLPATIQTKAEQTVITFTAENGAMVAKGEGEDSIIKWRVLNDRPNTIDRTATPRKV